MTDGVAHIEIDAESRLDLVRLLAVRRTPTVFVLGPDGRIAKRASGQPRMNFAAQLATNQKFELRDAAKSVVRSPESLVSWTFDRLTAPPFQSDAYNALLDYARAGGSWTGSLTQIATKASGPSGATGAKARRQPAGPRLRPAAS